MFARAFSFGGLLALFITAALLPTSGGDSPSDPPDAGTRAEPLERWLVSNSDDGTEVNRASWHASGYSYSLNRLGRDGKDVFDAGFRFKTEEFVQGDTVVFARLRFASFGSEITSAARLLIEGVLQDSPTTFSQLDRPSCKNPKTAVKLPWIIDWNWDPGTPDMPLYYSSPDITMIINEILALPGWGNGAEGKCLILTVSEDGSAIGERNFVEFDDYASDTEIRTPVLLEVCRTVYDTFSGKELVGRVTDSSAVVNLYSLVETDTFIEYGTEPGYYTNATGLILNQPAETPIEIVLDNLQPDTRYHYRLAYRRSGQGDFFRGPDRTFHTQRASGAAFSFAVIADEHLQLMLKRPVSDDRVELYRTTLRNIGLDAPDFMVSIGDFVFTDTRNSEVPNLQEATERYLLQRSCIDSIVHSVPFFLVIGNHEGEQGWLYDGTPDCLPVLSTLARKAVIPNPIPGPFYSGNLDVLPDLGLREDYYAWEWGDALFIVVAPFWYTTSDPDSTCCGWDWTMGQAQYDWLHETLQGSDARWKLVFIHHLTSTNTSNYSNTYYGRGGIEVAKFAVDGNPSFEWGGEDAEGNYVLDDRRPGWMHGAVHNMLAAAGVSIVFHGHDHFFARQELDGVVYQLCPMPGDSGYGYGFMEEGGYVYGDFLPNSGHLRVTVGPDSLIVDYVRSYLPGNGENGEIACSYALR